MAETVLETDRLILRNWQEEDREFFHFINSDDRVMKFFPIRRSREEADQVMDMLKEKIRENGYGFMAAALKSDNQPIGFVGISNYTYEPMFPEGTVEIGWRLAPDHWGLGYATEAAKRWLDYGFQVLNLPEIVSFAVHDNYTSHAVMQRIGMNRDPSRDFDHPGVPDTHPELKRHIAYAIKHG